jgi:chromosome segregation ATPase
LVRHLSYALNGAKGANKNLKNKLAEVQGQLKKYLENDSDALGEICRLKECISTLTAEKERLKRRVEATEAALNNSRARIAELTLQLDKARTPWWKKLFG